MVFTGQHQQSRTPILIMFTTNLFEKSKNSLNHRLRLHIFNTCSDKIKLADCAAYGAKSQAKKSVSLLQGSHTRPHAVANEENEYVQE